MDKKFFYYSFYTTTCVRVLVLMLFSMLTAQFAKSSCFVTFNDGRLYVFPDACIQSQIEDDSSISFVAHDGTIYTYSLEDISNIDNQLTKALPVFTSYKFNNKYNYQVYTDATGTITDNAINIEVAGIGKRLTASFTISDENARAYVDGKEQVNSESRLRFDNSRSYVVGYPGDLILTEVEQGQYAMMPFGHTYSVIVDFLTDRSIVVPRIDINTVGGVNITSKEVYVDAEIIIDGAGVFPSMKDSVQIRGRGNDSWSSNPNSKNPYRLKFASKVKPFGLPKGKSWVLLANKRKGSMLTNAIGMKAASLIGCASANHIIPVDLFINGQYKGSYNFTEKVGFAGNSVDLDDETSAALLELDQYYDEAATQKFKSTPYSIPVNIKHPEFGVDSTFLSLNVIRNRFNGFVADVYDGKDYSKHVNMDFLARFMMVNELIRNLEMLHPKSIFCYNENLLDPDSEFIFGPVWDLDWAFGYDGVNSTSYFNKSITLDYFNAQLTQQPFFAALRSGADMGHRFYNLWKKFRSEDLDELCEFCQDYYQYVRPSFARNKEANLDDTDYEIQAIQAVNWLRQRADYIFNKVRLEVVLLGDANNDGQVNIADVTDLIDYLLNQDATSINLEAADIDGDCNININDVTNLIDMLLSSNLTSN